MILVTTGTQLPFPRLIGEMDRLAGQLGFEVVAQTGDPEFRPDHLTAHAFLTPAEFDALFRRAQIVVAHAGIGTILSARRYGRPAILVPRRADLGEHRNDHQLATARAVEGKRGLYIAWEVTQIGPLLTGPALVPANETEGPELGRLQQRIAAFIAGG